MTTKPQKKITIKTEILKLISKEDLADLCNISFFKKIFDLICLKTAYRTAMALC